MLVSVRLSSVGADRTSLMLLEYADTHGIMCSFACDEEHSHLGRRCQCGERHDYRE